MERLLFCDTELVFNDEFFKTLLESLLEHDGEGWCVEMVWRWVTMGADGFFRIQVFAGCGCVAVADVNAGAVAYFEV